MAGETKDAAAVRIFPPAVSLAAIALGIGLQWLWPIDPGFELPAPARWWVGWGLTVAVIALLGGWPVAIQRRGGTSENPFTATTALVAQGPYRFTRNPMYLQMVLVCVGVAIALWNVWLFLLTPVAGWTLQRLAIQPEEEYLERKFGAEYLAYKARVRRWL